MPKKAHSEEQIVAVLRQGEAGEKVADICRKVGISEGTYYLWKKQYAGLGINELRELRQLREENGRLKRQFSCPSLVGDFDRPLCTLINPTAFYIDGRFRVCVNNDVDSYLL